MNPALMSSILFACLFGAVLLGMRLRCLLPEHHRTQDTKDSVKLAVGLVATMAALLLGLLVASAKGTYDTDRSEVIQMAAKIAFLDRVLAVYGPEAAEARAQFRSAVEQMIRHIWPAERGMKAQLEPNTQVGDAFYGAIQRLSPHDDMQRSLKAQAGSVAVELGQLRSLLVSQSAPSISKTLLVVVAFWLAIIFLSFGLHSPPNATAIIAQLMAALSVSGAIYLIMELDQPFNGLIRISSEPMLIALSHLVK
jgi:hypothetical protein